MKINPTTTKAQFLEIHLSEQEAAELAEQLKDQARKGQDPTQDQQKINQFARLNNRLEELKDDIKSKRNEIQTLKDAKEELEFSLNTEKDGN